MRWKRVKNVSVDILADVLGGLFIAIGVYNFAVASGFPVAGISGIAVIFHHFFKIPIGIMTNILNVPIVLVGFWKFGWKFMLSTFYCVVMTSVFTNLLAPFGAATNDILLAAIAGGALVAASIGVVFKCGATTGGTDIIIKLLRRRFPHLKTGALFMLTDATIVTVSAFVFRDLDAALYAAITVVITSLVMDVVLYGRDEAKMIYIISDHSGTITTRLLEELDIGVTHIEGTGAYSGKEKKVIFCVMRKTLAPRVEQIVREEDTDAFMIVSNATEIFGEGYKSYFSEKL